MLLGSVSTSIGTVQKEAWKGKSQWKGEFAMETIVFKVASRIVYTTYCGPAFLSLHSTAHVSQFDLS